MSKRSHIPDRVKLAATLLQLRGDDGKPLIRYEHAKLMTADQINSLFNFDHYPIRKADGGEDVPWNLAPVLIASHRIKTATKDAPEMAKDRKIARARALHDARMAEKAATDVGFEPTKPRTRKIQSAGFAKGHRPLRSRNTFRGGKRK